MMFGYLFGVLFLVFSYRLKDSKIIQIGYWISFLSIIPYFVLVKMIGDPTNLLRACCFFHALGNALLSPSVLSILAKGLKSHAQGRMYGLTDSIDTLAYWCGTLAIIFIMRVLHLDLIYLMLFSFLVFSVSWKFYTRFHIIDEQGGEKC